MGASTRGNGSQNGTSTTGRVIQTAAMAIGVGAIAADARSLYDSRYNRSRTMYQDQIQFPTDLTNVSEHYISFLFQAYQKRSINNAPFLRSTGTIRLPMPDNLKDDTEVTYSQKGLSPVVGASLDLAASGRIPDINNLTAADGRAVTSTGATAIGAGVLANRMGSTGDVVNSLKAFSGITQNPYQTVLFESPQFKTHTFTWKLIPSNEAESEKIKNIIRTFQFHMLPGVLGGAGILFSFPSMVTVSLYPSSDYLYRFKPCVIDKVSIDYAPGAESSPSFYSGTNAPTAVLLKISFQEIEYWTNNDFEANTFDDAAALAAQSSFTEQLGSQGNQIDTAFRNIGSATGELTTGLGQLFGFRGAGRPTETTVDENPNR
jgi:hypothetical protein